MKHRVAGRKLGRTSAHRLALLRNLSTSLFDKERITTTLMKAKELRPFAEKIVTLAKRETLHARRQVFQHIHDRSVVAKLFDSLSARYAQRPGGYTRIMKLGPRRGDNAEMAIIELVDSAVATSKKAADEAKGKKAKSKAAVAHTEVVAGDDSTKKAKKAVTRRRAEKAEKGPARGKVKDEDAGKKASTRSKASSAPAGKMASKAATRKSSKPSDSKGKTGR